ncbi:MAG: 30S ribosomal protein S4 [Patescibacteria group bacterium]
MVVDQKNQEEFKLNYKLYTMARDLGPKCKLCKREGVKLMLKGERCLMSKCAMTRKGDSQKTNKTTGGRSRSSDYNTQLREKQKTKRIYHLLENQFKLTFLKASKQKGDVGENLMKLLETRLDNVIFRLSLGSSRNQARQLVSHRHFTVNNKIVNIPSYQVKSNDIIKIKKSSLNNKQFSKIIDKLKKANIPSWLNFDIQEMIAKILHQPNKEDFEQGINTQRIVEFYSR